MKKMSKSKKIAIIIISVILVLAILVPIGLYIFGIFIVPHMIDGESIKAEYIGNPVMGVSWQEYDKQNLTFSSETKVFSEETFEIDLPAEFVVNEKATSDGCYGYEFMLNEDEVVSITVFEPIFFPEDKDNPEYEEEYKNYEAIQIGNKLLYSHAAKKAYGIKLGTVYDYQLLVNSIDIDTIDTENPNQVFLLGMIGTEKSIAGIGALTTSRAIYKLETDTYKGFIYDRSKVAETEDDNSYGMYTLEVFANDNLNYPYEITIMDAENILTEDDIFAIFNSFKVK